jgi:arylsulfatase
MPEKQPNIVFIITDQQRYDTIQALGFNYMDTPVLDRMVREGVSFENCFVSAASCAPARASLFTGLYPHTTGILKNADEWRRSWIEKLNEAGYHCTNIGKMHTWPFETPLGFDQRFVVENKDRYLEGRYYLDEWDKALRARGLVKQQREIYRQLSDYRERLGAFDWKLPEDTHPDFFVGDLATWWIRNYPKKDPLFLQIGFPGPHPPYDPIPRYAEAYLKKELPLYPVSPEELAGQPQPFHGMRVHNTEVDHDSVVHLLNPSDAQRHRQRAHYLANVTMIDQKIGEILEALEDQGYLENGIVVFTSDHGDCLTDHGHSQKWTMYDLVTRVPLVVWAPKRFSGRRVIEELCQQMDIGPAILELAGAEKPDPIEAVSLKPALEGEPYAGRPYVYAEQSGDGNFTTSQFMTMVRDSRWKLVHFLDEPWGQLFDLKEDPRELKNLWESTEAQTEKNRLLAELREWNIRSQFQTSSWPAHWR